MVIKSNTFQQNKLENNYLETNIQKDNYFCPAPYQFCMSCQSKSAGKPTSKPVRKPGSQQADQQVASQQASKPASPQLSKGAGGRGEALRLSNFYSKNNDQIAAGGCTITCTISEISL